MSIALSAVVRPSRLLRCALLLYGAAHAVAALALLYMTDARTASALVALACALAAGLAWRCACRNGTAQRIDVSGIGAVRVTVQQMAARDAQESVPVQILTGSTLWPCLLLLHLKGPDGQRRTLLIAPDSLSAEEFRALAVACRSIARRDNIFFEKNKIV